MVEAIHGVIRFWLDRGADGFRIDVVAGLIKDEQLRDNPVRGERDPDIPWYAEGIAGSSLQPGPARGS